MAARVPSLVWAGGDTIAIAGIGAALLGYLPPLAALIAIVWYAIQIYESQTLQNMLMNRRLRRLVALRGQATALELVIREKNDKSIPLLNKVNEIHSAAIAARDKQDSDES